MRYAALFKKMPYVTIDYRYASICVKPYNIESFSDVYLISVEHNTSM